MHGRVAGKAVISEPPLINATCSNSFSVIKGVLERTPGVRCAADCTFVRELRDRTLDGERGAWLEPLVHVLAQHATLIFLDE